MSWGTTAIAWEKELAGRARRLSLDIQNGRYQGVEAERMIVHLCRLAAEHRPHTATPEAEVTER